MKAGFEQARVPAVSGALLTSWVPWRFAGAAANKLVERGFEADSPFWPVYFYASVNYFVSTFECLKNTDKQKVPGADKPIVNFLQELKEQREKITSGPNIFWDFIQRERNLLHHRGVTGVFEREVTARPFLWDGDTSKVSSGKELVYGNEGESPLRLLGLAFDWFEENLRVIDQTAYEQIDVNPYSDSQVFSELVRRSYDRIVTSRLDYYY